MSRISTYSAAVRCVVASLTIGFATLAIAQSGPSVVNPCPAEDPKEDAKQACLDLIWVPTSTPWKQVDSEEGWNWCLPPADAFEAAPLGQWTPEILCTFYSQSMCLDPDPPLIMLCPQCFPPSMNGPGGCALALKEFMMSSLRERSVPSVGEPPDRCGGFQQTMEMADDLVDLPGLATALGTTSSQLKVEIAAMWIEEHGGAWAEEEDDSLCGIPLECFIAGIGAEVGGGQQFSLSSEQFAMLDSASGGALSGCDLCSDPGGGAPKRWGSLFGDQNGDAVSLDCLDLIQLLDSSGQCYPPLGEPGEMTREDVIDLAEEFMSQTGADCPKLSECLARWMGERMPALAPLTIEEMMELAVDACGNTFDQFPPDVIEDPDGVSYQESEAERMAEAMKQFPPDFLESERIDSETQAGWQAEPRWESWSLDFGGLVSQQSPDPCGRGGTPLPGDNGSGPRGTGGTHPSDSGSGPRGIDSDNPLDLSRQFPNQWIAPVDLRYGSKLEYEVDLSFPITGGHYTFSRTYRSGSSWTAAPLMGEGWTASSFTRLLLDEDSVRIGSNSGLQTTPPIPTDSGNLAEVGGDPVELAGPTHRTIQTTQLCVDGALTPVYRVSEPGQWSIDYFREWRPEGDPLAEPPLLTGCGAVVNPESALWGLPVQRRDAYGNTQTYKYEIVPTTESGSTARLSRIVVARKADGASDPGGIEAEIRFQWIIDPSPSLSSIFGRLRQVTAVRWLEEDVATVIAKTSYLYFDDLPDAQADLGTSGDLVQVTRSVRVDPSPGADGGAPVWHRRVTQYRYHGNTAASEWVVGRGEVNFFWDGGPHQLKLIVGASQIESFAALQDLGSPATRLEQAAATMLAHSDGEELPGSDSSVVDLATKVVEKYDDETEAVLIEYLQGGCGCGGSSSGAVHSKRYTFEYWSYGDPAEQWTTKVAEQVYHPEAVAPDPVWQANRTIYVDMATVGPDLAGTDEKPAHIVQRAIVLDDEAATPPIWVTAIEYDAETGLPSKVYPPSNEPTYTRATPTVAADFDPGASGFVREYEYNDDKRLVEEWITNVDDEETSYILTRRTWGDGTGNTRKYLPQSIELFRTPMSSIGSLDDDDVERTEFQYRFHAGGGDALGAVEVTTEWDGSAFNGPEVDEAPALVFEHEFFDQCGRNVWSRGRDGSISRRQFDTGNGRVALLEQNVDPPSSWPVDTTGLNGTPFNGRNDSGGSLTWTWTFDPLGRTRSMTTAAGVTKYLRRELRSCYDHPGLEYLAIVTLPPALGESSHAGPASILWVNGGGETIAAWTCSVSSAYVTDDDSTEWPTEITAYSVATQPHLALTRAKVTRSLSGQVESKIVWDDPSEVGPNGGMAVTLYRFDDLGRLDQVINPVGTVTRTIYDSFGRVRKVGIGVLGSSGDPDEDTITTVQRNVYDGGGVGNGNLTWTVAKLEEEAINASSEDEEGEDRVTVFHYDWRDRLILTEGPTGPFEAIEYDNLDRVVRTADYSSAPTIPFDLGASAPTRTSLQRSTYSQRGLLVRDEVAIDPTSEEGSSQEFLGWFSWFDEAGREVGSWSPNAPARKTTFDGLGRPSIVYLSDRGGDPAVTASSHEHVHDVDEHKSNTSGDHVLEQIEYGYVSELEDDRRGLLQSVVRRQRLHDAEETDTELSWSNSITTFNGLFYDVASRLVAKADYGTNDSSARFIKVSSGDAPTIDQAAVPASSDTVLVTQTEYDARGLVGATTDPMGRTTRFVRDGRGRVIATIENEESEVTFEWDADADTWDVSNASTSSDVNRVTTFVFDRAGNLRKQTAHQASATADQVTEYLYGVNDEENGPEITNGQSVVSSIFSNDLLRQVIYPEGDGGGDEAFRSVYVAWNRQGEPVGTVDQNNTLHEFERDIAGRVIADKATKGAGSSLDDAIDLIEVERDSIGRPSKVTGLKDGGTPTVKNQVEFQYTALGQLARVYQHQKGAVTYDGSGVPSGDTRLVGYTYSTEDGSEGNYSRLAGLEYPRHANSSGVNPQTMDVNYGSTGFGDAISRPDSLKINMSATSGQKSFAIYSYLGLATPVVVDFGGDSTPDIQLDRTLSLNGKRSAAGYATQTAGLYPGFDQFGRVALHTWADGALTTGGSYPTKPQIIAIEYGHDRNGTRIHAFDVRRQNQWPMSHEYTNDKLDRLTKARRNKWTNLTGGSANAAGTQAWTLDPLGNWSDVSTWTSGSTPTPETRTHNDANEILTRDVNSSAPAEHTFDFDNAGNLASNTVSGGSTVAYTHDLWNRLVKVTVGSTVKLEQEYNGLNWRTLKREDTGGTAGLDEERAFTYSGSWQLLEERVDTNYTGAPGLNKRVQYLWGLRHTDDCVMHRADLGNDGDYQDTNEGRWFHLTDGQFSTVAIVNHTGTLIERTSYDSYGKARHHQPGDVDGVNGNCDASDKAIVDAITGNGLYSVPISSSSYRAEADLNRDGWINSTDSTLANRTASALPSGEISIATSGGPDSSVGWCSYVFNGATLQYLVRFRSYDPVLGRWIERDPSGYADGMSLYECVGSAPIGFVDPMGLDRRKVVPGSVQPPRPPKPDVLMPGMCGYEEAMLAYWLGILEALPWRVGSYEPTFWQMLLGATNPLEGALDIIGWLPFVGEPADILSGLYATWEGRYDDASWSFGAAIPFVGWVSSAGKQGNKVRKAYRKWQDVPILDATGKVHGDLPKILELGRYDPEMLRKLHGDLQKSIQQRIRKTSELGRDVGHAKRQADEQRLLEALERYLNPSGRK